MSRPELRGHDRRRRPRRLPPGKVVRPGAARRPSTPASSASMSKSNAPPPPPPELPPPELPPLLGAAATLNVTELLLALPVPVDATRRNWSPDMAVVVLDTVSVRVALPEYAPPSVRSAKVVEPEGARCHLKEASGQPEASAVKVALPPAVSEAATGCVTMTGAVAGTG